MKFKDLGNSGLRVSAIRLGCMGMSHAYGAAPNRREMSGLLADAVDMGYTFFDTAESAGTIKSESYPLEIRKLYPDISVSGVACPLWVSLVENNEATGPGADYFVRKYIDQLLTLDPLTDTVILGCTHYPLLLPKIQQYMPAHIRTVAQGGLVAESLKDYLHRHPEMDARCTRQGTCRYYTTEATEKFSESASTFFNRKIDVQHITLE